MQFFLTLVLASYCFVVHFGVVFRFGISEGGLGVPTVLALILIFSGMFQIPKQIRHAPILFALSILFAWVAFSSMLAPSGIVSAYSALAKQVLYLCIAASVASWQFDEKRLRFVALSLALGLGLSSGLTIIDHMGWMKIPHCNSVVHGSDIAGQSGHIIQAGGFFSKRTAMASFFSLSVTCSTILALVNKNWLAKLFYAAAAASGSVAILLTHNRSAIVAIAGALVAYVLFSNLLTASKRVQIMVLGGLLAVGVFATFAAFFPQHLAVYKDKFLPYLSGDRGPTLVEGDYVRVKHAEYVFKSLLHNPIGNGITKLPLKEGGFGTHNTYITWIWAGGVFALIWLIPFALSVWKSLYVKVPVSPDRAPYVDAFRFAILAFLAHNMAHESFGTGLFWAMLAMVISVRSRSIQEAVYYQWQRMQGQPVSNPMGSS